MSDNMQNPCKDIYFENLWTDVDFNINKTFWDYHGHKLSLPFRLINLVDMQQILGDLGIPYYLYGRTLLDIHNSKTLRVDHDDDIIVNNDVFLEKFESFRSHLEKNNFRIIRNSERLFSIARYERYIDLHFSNEFQISKSVRVEGYNLQIPERPNNILYEKYGRKFQQHRNFLPRFILFLRRLIIHPRKTLRELESFRRKSPLDLYRKLIEIKINKSKIRPIKYEDFLKLKIDTPGSDNWTWRKSHLSLLFREGENIGQAIDRIKSEGGLNRLVKLVKEVDTGLCFVEPINLSRRFWTSGNNFFIYSAIYGYRHHVIPYAKANLYIQLNVRPKLFSSDYFSSLPEMSNREIEEFLNKNPIEIRDGSVTSGRHRVAAMVGRLVRGEKYIEIKFK